MKLCIMSPLSFYWKENSSYDTFELLVMWEILRQFSSSIACRCFFSLPIQALPPTPSLSFIFKILFYEMIRFLHSLCRATYTYSAISKFPSWVLWKSSRYGKNNFIVYPFFSATEDLEKTTRIKHFVCGRLLCPLVYFRDFFSEPPDGLKFC